MASEQEGCPAADEEDKSSRKMGGGQKGGNLLRAWPSVVNWNRERIKRASMRAWEVASKGYQSLLQVTRASRGKMKERLRNGSIEQTKDKM